MHDGISALIDHGACIEDKDKAFFDHLSMHEANHPPSGQPLGQEVTAAVPSLSSPQPHLANVPHALFRQTKALRRWRHRRGRTATATAHVDHLKVVRQNVVLEAEHHHVERQKY